jgi:8'-apo-carotenoid 13,14-cleaving dioxygenase
MVSPVETLIRNTVTKGVLKVAEYNRQRLNATTNTANPYLAGIHLPMTEEKTVLNLQVTGTIPAQLDGRYVRIGPNPIKPPNPASYHWFVGDGMVHGVRLAEGKALWYRNRWIRSTPVSKVLGEASAPGPRHGSFETVNTNVLGHAGKTWGLVEAGPYPVELDEELNTVAHNPFEGTLKGSFTAHPHLDPVSGEMHAICYSGTEVNSIRHVVVGKDGKVRREEAIAVQHGPSIHECMITKNFVVIFDLPVTFSMKALLGGQSFPYRWNPDHRARVGLLPKEGTNADIIWCDVEPCYVFHASNAYENATGEVIIDVAAHNTMFADSIHGPDSKTLKLERWTANLHTKQVSRRVIDDTPQEFPRCDERRLGSAYRYAYAMSIPSGYDSFGAANMYYKHDLETGTREAHDFGADRFPGEFVFVPKSADADEDEGWLMGYVVNMGNQTTDLVILNAQDLSGAPQAVITMPHRIPPGFHGNWIPAS